MPRWSRGDGFCSSGESRPESWPGSPQDEDADDADGDGEGPGSPQAGPTSYPSSRPVRGPASYPSSRPVGGPASYPSSGPPGGPDSYPEDHEVAMVTTPDNHATQQMDEGTQQTEDSSAHSTPYLRGATRLPSVPHHERRPLIRPAGRRGWLVLEGPLDPPRTPATILGCLCRKHFPGLVDLGDGRWEPAWTWGRYALGEDDEKSNKQERVLADFWSYFKAEPGRENLADQTAHRACQKYVGDMIHEAKLQAHVDYYRSIEKEPLKKAGARKVKLTREQHLQVPPSWCMSYRSAWARIVDRFLDLAHIEKQELGKRKRALRAGPTHHQGSRNLPNFKRALEAT